MKVIIPMAGVGQRFLDAGYRDPKPLILVDGKPVIEHVVSMFSKDDEFVFVCNREHLRTTNMRSVLERVVPKCKIIGIDPHKLGPVFTVAQAFDYIDDDEPVIVSYCDFYEAWDYEGFKKTIAENKCDAAVTAYKGFHPHLLGPNFYAAMRVDDDNFMLECREKYSFTENKMDSFHQSGKFYFASGSIMKKYFQDIMSKGIDVNGEYYVSLVTQLMREAGLKIYVYEVEHFFQWGTPEDLRNYIYWSGIARSDKLPIVASGNDLKILNYWKCFFDKYGTQCFKSANQAEIKGIIIDLDDTLYDYNGCNVYAEDSLFEVMSRDFGMDYEEIKETYYNSRAAVKRPLAGTASSHSRLLYIQKALEALRVPGYISKAIYYESFYWQKFFEKMEVFEGVLDFLKLACDSGKEICIATDMLASTQMKKIIRLGIQDYVHFIVSSEEAGKDKPGLAIFALAMEKMGLGKEQVIVLGDDEHKDVAGAQAAGLRAIKITPEMFRDGSLANLVIGCVSTSR
jgi:HAD superfamily hydrolase (TIGR01549 family)